MIQSFLRRCRLKNQDFSIISNNCWGGLISQYYGLPYNSPTCGILIGGPDYIKFCKNIKYYLSLKLNFINYEVSKYKEEFRNFNPHPVAKLGDIEIYFPHYHSETEAAEKWYRRINRINWDNIIFKISQRQTFTPDIIKEFAELDLPNKLIFADEKINNDTIVIPGISRLKGDETPITLEYLNITKYLNTLMKS